jgi:post-segregation antitoxin (ccd killing protein)
MQPARNASKPKKKPANVSVRVDLLNIAREDKLNLSGLLESSLIDYCKKKQEKEWLEKNRKAISDMNAFVEECGVFSDGRRLF